MATAEFSKFAGILSAALSQHHLSGFGIAQQQLELDMEELYKKDLHEPDNHDGVITHLEPDILECEAKWALGSITMNKASGSDGISVELFQILKDGAVKVLHSTCEQISKIQQWPQLEKVSFHSNPKERQCQKMFKILHNCTHLTG